MITIQITTSDTEKLRNFNMAALRPAMFKSVLLLESKMKSYPSPPSGSRYRRTGTLGRRWTHEVKSGGNSLEGKVGNNTSYGPFVQSKAMQASIHKGRWQTDEQVMEESIPAITGFFENTISDVLGG